MIVAAKHKIIIDTDTAGDDAAALILAAKSDTVDILGVTVAAGNVSLDQAALNSLAALELAKPAAPVVWNTSGYETAETVRALSEKVSVCPSSDRWFGVTYQEDIPLVKESFRKLIADGVYKENLWEK